MYIADLVALIDKYGFCPHLYTDDTQIYGSTRYSAVNDLEHRLSACIDDVYSWMQSNCLQLNTSKTELLWCTTTRRQHLLTRSALRISGDAITPSTTVWDLGIKMPISACARTSNGLSPAALLFCGNFVASDDQFHRLCFRSWSLPLCCPGWITVCNATLVGLPANLLNRLVCAQRCCSVGCWTAMIRPHHRHSCQFSLVACTWTHQV